MKKLAGAIYKILTNKMEYDTAIWAYNKNCITPEYRLAVEIVKYFNIKKFWKDA